MVPPALKRHIEALVVGGSTGSVAALGQILPALPAQFPATLVVVHVLPSASSLLAQIFAPRCHMRVREAEAQAPIERGVIYFAPADYHLLVEPSRHCSLSIEPPVHFSRPAIDVLFESAADAYETALAAVVLTGASSDGAQGLAAVHRSGGQTFIQSPESAEADFMPRAAISSVPQARVLPLPHLLQELLSLPCVP